MKGFCKAYSTHACMFVLFFNQCSRFDKLQETFIITGLKVNDQLVAHATRFLAVRLKTRVVTPSRLKSQSTVRLL